MTRTANTQAIHRLAVSSIRKFQKDLLRDLLDEQAGAIASARDVMGAVSGGCDGKLLVERGRKMRKASTEQKDQVHCLNVPPV